MLGHQSPPDLLFNKRLRSRGIARVVIQAGLRSDPTGNGRNSINHRRARWVSIKVGASIADVVSGMNAFSGILLALLSRASTNRGQHVDISMQEGQLALHTYLASAWLNAGVEPPRNGNRHLSIAPYSTYQAKDGWLNIAVANQKLWGLFCQILDNPVLKTDPRFEKQRCES